jgi:ribose 5-phosphate isomerase A
MDDMKRAAAAAALLLVEDGMRLGLGTGSTAWHFTDLLGARVASGLRVSCVPTSERTRLQAESLHIPLTTLEETPELDLTVDGADEIDKRGDLIKGGGGALLREKIVAAASRYMVVIADASKCVAKLGAFALPVEVNLFGIGATKRLVEQACSLRRDPVPVTMRRQADGTPFLTDGGHAILDCSMGAIEDVAALQARLFAIPGVVETGLFVGICDRAFIAGRDGVALHRFSQ